MKFTTLVTAAVVAFSTANALALPEAEAAPQPFKRTYGRFCYLPGRFCPKEKREASPEPVAEAQPFKRTYGRFCYLPGRFCPKTKREAEDMAIEARSAMTKREASPAYGRFCYLPGRFCPKDKRDAEHMADMAKREASDLTLALDVAKRDPSPAYGRFCYLPGRFCPKDKREAEDISFEAEMAKRELLWYPVETDDIEDLPEIDEAPANSTKV